MLESYIVTNFKFLSFFLRYKTTQSEFYEQLFLNFDGCHRVAIYSSFKVKSKFLELLKCWIFTLFMMEICLRFCWDENSRRKFSNFSRSSKAKRMFPCPVFQPFNLQLLVTQYSPSGSIGNKTTDMGRTSSFDMRTRLRNEKVTAQYASKYKMLLLLARIYY